MSIQSFEIFYHLWNSDFWQKRSKQFFYGPRIGFFYTREIGLDFSIQDFWSYWSSTCPLTRFFRPLSHVIYLKLTKVLSECLLSKMNEIIPKKNNLALGNLAKLIFWLILSFKNLQNWKVNTFLSFSGESYIWED
jgi:hypothetical protein